MGGGLLPAMALISGGGHKIRRTGSIGKINNTVAEILIYLFPRT